MQVFVIGGPQKVLEVLEQNDELSLFEIYIRVCHKHMVSLA